MQSRVFKMVNCNLDSVNNCNKINKKYENEINENNNYFLFLKSLYCTTSNNHLPNQCPTCV